MKTRGYSLVEMAIVIAVLGVVGGGMLSVMTGKQEAASLTSQEARLDAVDEALAYHVKLRGRLPCPARPSLTEADANFGREDCAVPADITTVTDPAGGANEQVWIGMLPSRTLDLPDTYLYDEWGSRIGYAVIKLLTNVTGFDDYATTITTGVIRITDAAGNQMTAPSVDGIVAYAFFSYGKDKKGGRTRTGSVAFACDAGYLDTGNCNNADNTFVDTEINDSATAANYFYDRLRWKAYRQLRRDAGIAEETEYLYVADWSNNRVQKFDGNGNYISQFGNVGSGSGQFQNPAGMAIDGNGNLWITDYTNNRVQTLDGSGYYLSQINNGTGFGNGQFIGPRSLAFDSAGNVYVTDYSNHRVQKFTGAGVYVSQFGKTPPPLSGSLNGEFTNPNGIAIDSSGNLWVVDSNNHRVQKFNSAGVYQSQFGSSAPLSGVGNGQFWTPVDIAIDSSGNLWVTDGNNHRVQKFNSAGVYQSQFGSFGIGNGQLRNPRGIAIDSDDNIWISDGNNHRVQEFDDSGNYLSQFGSGPGSGNGQFNWAMDITIGTQ